MSKVVGRLLWLDGPSRSCSDFFSLQPSSFSSSECPSQSLIQYWFLTETHLSGIHAFAILIGLILAGRSTKNKDHEFLRSGAIDRLSRTYELEDGGLWSRADEALARLERRNSKKKTIQMSGGVASINAESRELDIGDEEPGDIRVSGVEVSADTGVEQNSPESEKKPTIQRKSRGISAWLDRRAERVARKRLEKIRSKQSGNSAATTISCKSCGSTSPYGTSYCTTCGSLL